MKFNTLALLPLLLTAGLLRLNGTVIVASETASTTTTASASPAPVSDLTKDPAAIKILDAAAKIYSAYPRYSAVVHETSFSGDVTFSEMHFQRQPAKACVVWTKVDYTEPGICLADGQFLYRLEPDAPHYTRALESESGGPLAAFSGSAPMLMGPALLLAGVNAGLQKDCLSAKIETGTDYQVMSVQGEPLDVVRLKLLLGTDDKSTDVIFGLGQKSHTLAYVWMERNYRGVLLRTTLEMAHEIPNKVAAKRLVFKAPSGVTLVAGKPWGGKQHHASLEPVLIVPALEPRAVELLDKASKLYGGAKTLQLRAQGTITGPDQTQTNAMQLYYQPGDHLYLSAISTSSGQVEKYLAVANGQTMTRLVPTSEVPMENQIGEKDYPGIPEVMATNLFPLGRILAQLTHNQNPLSGLTLLQSLPGAISLEAKTLSAQTLGAIPCDRISIHGHYRTGQGLPDSIWEEQIWLSQADSRLQRVKLDTHDGTDDVKATEDVTGQTFDAPVPAAQFVFKRPSK